MFIVWNEEYSVGIEEVDRQHKTIFTLINKAHDDFCLQGNLSTVEVILMELAEYVATHFSYEESLMQKHRPLNYDSHLEHHKAFKKKISDYGLVSENQRAPLELLKFLANWLYDHLLKEDRQSFKKQD